MAHLGLQYVFADAISGDELEDADLLRVYDADMNRIKFKRPLSRNEIACTLGHRQIWQRIADSPNHVSLALEDDATFAQNPRHFLEAIDQCAECFENVMIKLDGVPDRNARVLGAVADQSLVLSDRLPPRTTGYILGRRAATRLLELAAPIARPIDIDLKFYWEHEIPILTLAKQMVKEREALNSTIEPCRIATKTGSSLSRFVRNLVYQVKYTHGRLSHPLHPDLIEGLGSVLRAKSQVHSQS